MVNLTLLLSIICAFSLITFVVLFGHIPALKHTFVGTAKTHLTETLPHGLAKLDEHLTGSRIEPALSGQIHAVVHERHPIVLCFYLALYIGGVSVYLLRVAPDLSRLHHAILPILIALPLVTLYKAASTDPGIVTAENHARFLQRYPFDHVLYRPGQECRTCRRPKVARSKHCPLCNVCIAKHDHHWYAFQFCSKLMISVWINGCVGEQNMRYFFAFLVCNIITFSYASLTMLSRMRTQRRLSYRPLSILATLRLDPWVGSLALFASICDLLVIAFLVYHLYLIWSGLTTNETLKFEDIRGALDAGDLALIVHGRQARLVRAGSSDATSGRHVKLQDMENIYDAGWYNNLMAILSPMKRTN
jgi:palmitoyltransferase